ncbi:putative amidase AmiA2 [Frankia canadensis]|uniref:Putative amidase AmiA2 n=1 Tax=Frankia canadensis TaxID=1836972 RepID=A0A2I2KNT3_9ACTN|nr:amidase [Frankia canadensis]SNQ47335.1 putative amidase AmiA2 [Frankia canadensis]SOU54625.1 putative amidase AmiA2 [Frankia canadensis]
MSQAQGAVAEWSRDGPLDGVATLAERLAAGEVSSRELVAAALDRIEATQATLNAFRRLRAREALEEAAAADEALAAVAAADRGHGRAWRAARAHRPLLGVPIAIKDDTDIAGLPTAFGAMGEFPPAARDSEMVRLLKAAGAIIVGKTNTPEFGQWPFTEGPAFGVTRNPWDLDHSPGGSSGGAAAAVAAGLVPAAIGSDGAGSVRIPAAWTHLVGIKPRRGRISSAPVAEQFNGLTVYGPLTRTVADGALLLDVLSGSLPVDRARPPAPAETFLAAAGHPPPRLCVGLSLHHPYSGMPASLDPAVRAGVERIAGALTRLGHDVVPVEPPYGLLGTIFLPRSMDGIRDWAGRVPNPSLLDPRTAANARTGRLLRPFLPAARAAEPLARLNIGRIFRRVDVVLAPTTATPPPRVGELNRETNWATDQAIVAACPFAWPWNVLGWPAVNVPAGRTPAGLPVGAQLMGPAAAETLLISLAAQLEDDQRWQLHRPGERATHAM